MVSQCIYRMIGRSVGHIVVMDGDAIAAIFTERDHVRYTTLTGHSPEDTEVCEAMTSDRSTANEDGRSN